jgi:hypothetical protein
MVQTWRDLLFAHWALPPERLASLVPASLTLDLHEGRAFLGIVPFRMERIRLRGLPSILGLSAFPELNVRTYVVAAEKPGVLFLSLDGANVLAAAVARRLYHLPYWRARMSCRRKGNAIRYRSERKRRGRPAASFRARYRPVGPASMASAGSLDHWLTERYCLYAEGRRGRLYRGEIHHAPWRLEPAEAAIDVNTMAEAAGLILPDTPPVLHFAERLDAVLWSPERVGT